MFKWCEKDARVANAYAVGTTRAKTTAREFGANFFGDGLNLHSEECNRLFARIADCQPTASAQFMPMLTFWSFSRDRQDRLLRVTHRLLCKRAAPSSCVLPTTHRPVPWWKRYSAA